ncbi:hypothetical protein CPB83DRAFT_924921 [Crepidotus variabilis]|uniref:Uncharacterized protein n=1 Tax=Crepidotus variabilis TaxID=179855 RepID=A0A9P6ETV5_9AGAR|nr:hypothetical protein CPB83DRAFT_924921 [Crepidotus variabilis]
MSVIPEKEPPPSYNSSAQGADIKDSDVPPPTYTVPTQFKVGNRSTKAPLVSIQEIKGHLALLNAFAELKNEVDGVTATTIHGVTLDKERRWGWFVGCAVERFDKWCRALRPEHAAEKAEIIMPPLDVIMVWHAYMLNPRWFAEDAKRIPACRNLKALELQFNACLLGQFASVLTQPSPQRQSFWEICTQLPFDYSIDGTSPDAINKKTISCHYCAAPVEVPLLNAEGTGYLQQGFKANCAVDHTYRTITKETLAAHKLAVDLASPYDAVEALNYFVSHSGAVFTPIGSIDLVRVDRVKKQVVKLAEAAGWKESKHGKDSQKYQIELARTIGVMLQFSMANYRQAMKPVSALLMKVFSAYGSEKPYSVELVGAVLRQESFVRKMYDLGWTRPGFFDDSLDELALQHALARYHAFLDLMSSTPTSFFVPTLDIDLVWHTHQLIPSRYDHDCTTYVERFIDHDDKIEGLRLSSAFDITCRAWKERFHVDYTHCGCPIPGDSIGRRLSKLVGMHPPAPPSYLVPFNRPDLLSGTHPSDHNAVRFMDPNPTAHKMMEQRYEGLRKKKDKEAKKAAKKAEKLEAEGKLGLRGPHAHSEDRNRSANDPYYYGYGPYGYGYGYPFIAPVPIYGPIGGGCVSSCGGAVHQGGDASGGVSIFVPILHCKYLTLCLVWWRLWRWMLGRWMWCRWVC